MNSEKRRSTSIPPRNTLNLPILTKDRIRQNLARQLVTVIRKTLATAVTPVMNVAEALPRVAAMQRARQRFGTYQDVPLWKLRQIREQHGSPPFDKGWRGIDPRLNILAQFSLANMNGYLTDTQALGTPSREAMSAAEKAGRRAKAISATAVYRLAKYTVVSGSLVGAMRAGMVRRRRRRRLDVSLRRQSSRAFHVATRRQPAVPHRVRQPAEPCGLVSVPDRPLQHPAEQCCPGCVRPYLARVGS